MGSFGGSFSGWYGCFLVGRMGAYGVRFLEKDFGPAAGLFGRRDRILK